MSTLVQFLVLAGCTQPTWRTTADLTDTSADPSDSASGDTEDTGGSDTGGDGDELACEDAAPAAETLVLESCAACHGAEGTGQGGFSTIEDVPAMVDAGMVVPGEPDQSTLWTRVAAGEMPPSGALEATEQAILHDWIACGADDWRTEADRGFVSDAAVWEALQADLDVLDDRDRENARYLSLVHLYNADVPDDQLAAHGRALSKLVASLSWELSTSEPLPVVALDAGLGIPTDINEAGLVYRLDLDALGWDDGPPDRWETLLAVYPYGIRPETTEADRVREQTGSRLPVIHGDWFASEASRPPLYYDLLGIADTREGFLDRFLPSDFQDDMDAGTVDCAGFQESGVSENNRVICRHDAVFGSCWLSYDFAASDGDQNIFSNPTGFVESSDGGEIICSLRTGQQAYFIHDADGNRLDTAPVEIVFDTHADAASVETGLSCMRCHDQGMIPKEDEVRDAVSAYPEVFDEETIALVEDWFATHDRMDAFLTTDTERFVSANEALGISTEDTEPVWQLAEDHAATVDAERASAELGLTADELDVLLYLDDEIALQLYALTNGGTVTRTTFDAVVAGAICSFELGAECGDDACGTSELACLEGQSCDTDTGTCSPE